MLQKFAYTDLSFSSVPTESEFRKFAAAAADPSASVKPRQVIKYNPEHVYGRFRAIGAIEVDGPNANADAFPYGQFLDRRPGYGYKSFEGKHAYIEHNSSNISNAVGDLYASYLNRFNTTKFAKEDWDGLTDEERAAVLASRAPHEDGSIEVLMSVDRHLSPKIARMVESGSPVGVSMGTNIDYSECSVCGHRAYTEPNYCSHIKFSKGQHVLVPAEQISNLVKSGTLKPEWLPHILSRGEDIKAVRTASRKMVYAKVFEINYGLSFFELSFVANPAFSRGYKLEKIASETTPDSWFTPRIILANKPVELALKVSNNFFNDLVDSYGKQIGKTASQWDEQDYLRFMRDPVIAKDVLCTGNVLEILTPVHYAKQFVNANIDLSPSTEADHYQVTDPSVVEDFTFTSGVDEGEPSSKLIARLLRRSLMKKQAEYEGLPSTAEFTGDKGVDSREGETKLYHDWAANGSSQIEKEKESRPNGTIFIDAIVTKKKVSDTRGKVLKSSIAVKSLISKVKLALGGPPEAFLQSMKSAPITDGMGAGPSGPPPPMPGLGGPGPGVGLPGLGGPDPLGGSPLDGGMPFEMSKEEVPEVLQNTLGDLEEIQSQLEQVETALGGSENEAKEALARTRRWSASLAKKAEVASSSAADIVCEAEQAIRDAIEKIQAAERALSGGGTEEKESNPFEKSEKPVKSEKSEKAPEKKESPFESKSKPENKSDKETDNNKGGDAMDKNAALHVDDNTIRLLGSLKDVFSSKTVKAEEEKKDEEKDEKKDEEKEEKKAATKEATAQPPTGARDPGDYAEVGAIESTEMNAWWKKYYPEFEKMKATEEKTDFTTPEGKVELLTGPVGEYAEHSHVPGEAAKEGVYGPKSKAAAIIVKRIRNASNPRRTFYAVVKLADDSSIEGAFTANFDDVAGTDNSDLGDFQTFLSDDYMNEITASIKAKGLEATRTAMYGKVAQLEGVTPGKTQEVNPLYDSHEKDKKSNEKRDGETLSGEEAHGKSGDGAYYAKAYGDKGYAAELTKANTHIASLETELNKLKGEKRAEIVAKRAIHLARVAASRGIIPFEYSHIEKQASEYMTLDDKAYNTVFAHLMKLQEVDKRALTAYQIPEAENMQRGVVRNSLNAVNDVRIEGKDAEDVAPEGIQPSVKSDSKIAGQDENIQKTAGVVPQFTVDPSVPTNRIPNISGMFTTVVSDLQRVGAYDKNKHLLRSNRRSR